MADAGAGGAEGYCLRQGILQNQRLHRQRLVSLFLRRPQKRGTFEGTYARGGISHTAKRIYDIVREGDVALHEIKTLGCFGKSDKSGFDRALVELQMGMFLTVTGRKQKKNKYGIEYGWNSTVFTTVEQFWAERDVEIPELDPDESYEKIRQQILLLNPGAEEKTIRKFVKG